MSDNNSSMFYKTESDFKVFLRSSSLLELKPPRGWIYLNKTYIEERYAERIGKKLPKGNIQIKRFFDGTMPLSFDVALTESVPRRLYVKQLQEKINEAARNKELRVTLLTGPGGEGKSTILRQLAIDLVRQQEPKLHILFRKPDEDARLRKKDVEKLLHYKSNDEEDANHTFVFVSDNAHTIVRDIFDCVKMASFESDAPNKIQFLLASRGTHLHWKNAPKNSEWKRIVNDDFEVKINQLTEDDANKIVAAWDEAGILGTELESKTAEERGAMFFNAAKDEKIRDENSNSFYRAIFKMRENQTLESYVEEILDGFEEIPILDGSRTLRDCYAHIVILHADGFPLLTKPILQRVLNCSEHELDDILRLLDDEKKELLASQSSKYVLARHDVFAEEAKKILLEKKFPEYFHKTLCDLAVAAQQSFEISETNHTEIEKWNKLPRAYYYDLNQRSLGVKIAEAKAKLFPNAVRVTQWARLLRENRQREEAAKHLKNYYEKLNPDKGYFVEWAVTLGLLDKSFLSVWLAAIVLSSEFKEAASLSDDVKKAASQGEPQIQHLCSLGKAFGKSFAKTADTENKIFYNPERAQIFKSATEGIIRLISDERAKANAKSGFDFDKSERDKAEIHQRIGSKPITDLDLKETVQKTEFIEKSFTDIEAGVELAYQLRHLDNERLPESLPAPPLDLTETKRIFGIGKEIEVGKVSRVFTTRVLGSLTKSGTVRRTEFNADRFPFYYDRDTKRICDNKDLEADLSDSLKKVLKYFFEKNLQIISNQLTFAEIAEKWKELTDDDNEKEVARNFQRELHDQLRDKYGVDATQAEIIKTWHNNGYQLGKDWDTSKTRRYIDALQRPSLNLDENRHSNSDRKLSSTKPNSD